jgi:hypothetical protein
MCDAEWELFQRAAYRGCSSTESGIMMHYFNAENGEIGYECLGSVTLFNPPRKWHPSFLNNIEITRLDGLTTDAPSATLTV